MFKSSCYPCVMFDVCINPPCCAVTGEANFSMETTSLTVGGFNQPSVARSLIELPGNAEKGLSQRFLWLFPRPVYSQFDSLEPTNKTFTEKIGVFIHTKIESLWFGVDQSLFSSHT